MVSIGFRASPKRVTYAIVNGTLANGISLLSTSYVFVPPALEVPRQLQFVRTTLLDIMEEYAVLRAGLRSCEAVATGGPAPFRLNLEGVIQELLASSTAERFVAGPIATIASLLEEPDRTVIKRYISGELVPSYATNWDTLSVEQREAVLMAIAATNIGRASTNGDLADAQA